jgi:heat shock protein HslJ
MRNRTVPRRRLAVSLALVVLSLLLAACSSGSSLTGKTWKLTAITEKVPAFQGVVPAADQSRYTITFNDGGKADIKADCNNVGATYTTTSSGGITITPGPSTLMACPPDSMDQQYLAGLSQAQTYAISGDQLTLTLKDGGTLVHTSK